MPEEQRVLIITILLAVLGWLIAVLLQNNQHKKGILYDIYKQFINLKKGLYSSIISLRTITSPPFILMDVCLFSDKFGHSNEQSCIFEGKKKWDAYTHELSESYFSFNERHNEIIALYEDWMAALYPLLPIEEQLIERTKKLETEALDQIRLLQSYPSEHGDDWRKWDQEEVKKISNKVKECADEIGQYVYDFMVIIHNELLSGFFGHERPCRRTFDDKYDVLTRNGFIKSIDKHKIFEVQSLTELFLKKVKLHLESRKKSSSSIVNADEENLNFIAIDGVCPRCKELIQVYEIDKNADVPSALFLCGHSWEMPNERLSFNTSDKS